MERNQRDNYYQNYDRNRMDQDYDRHDSSNRYGHDRDRDYDYRHWVNENREDFRERGVWHNDEGRSRNYRDRDYDMEDNYRSNTRRQSDQLGDIRQGYGYSSFGDHSDRRNPAGDMQRERNARYDQGYGQGRPSGYSGSAFGGANYSSRGDFGGSSDYGSMSGSGGNMDNLVSSSGYGGGYRSSERGAPDYRNMSGDRAGDIGAINNGSGFRRQHDWGAETDHQANDNRRNSGRRDRGGYYNYDKNSSW